MSSSNSERLISFPIWIPFIYFSSVITVTGTLSTMLNNTGKSGHSFLVSVLRGNAFSFTPLRIMLAVGLQYMAFIMFSYIPSVSTFWRIFTIAVVD